MSVSTLSFALLHTLDTLLETRNLSHAARRLGQSQSALSRQLAQLRLQFSDPLLARHGRAYVLTPRAEALVGQVKQLLAQLDVMLSPAQFVPGECDRSFALASSDYIAVYLVPELMARLAEAAPRASVKFHIWRARSEFDRLADGKLDLAITLLDDVPPDLHVRRMGEDRAVCVMRSAHPLATAPMSLDGYLSWPHVKISDGGDEDSFIERCLAASGRKRDVRLVVPYFGSALSLVSRSDCLVTMPRYMAESLADSYPITWRSPPFDVPAFHYGVLWHARSHNDPAHQWFRNQVFAVCQQSRFMASGDRSYPRLVSSCARSA
jgi:DNA-binding transcriptional LysR family regulator